MNSAEVSEGVPKALWPRRASTGDLIQSGKDDEALRNGMTNAAARLIPSRPRTTSGLKFHALAKSVAATRAGWDRAVIARSGERVMYGRKQRMMLQKTPVTGGTPITETQALALRRVVFGSASVPPRAEWIRTGLLLREPEKELAYGLRGPRNGTRGLLSVIQAFLIRHFLFEEDVVPPGGTPPSSIQQQAIRPEQLLRPNRIRQLNGLARVISSILWRISERSVAVVVLPQSQTHVGHSPEYFQDGVTEKLHIFHFTSLEDLEIFIKQYLYLFTDDPGPGTLLVLYSAVLTRGCEKIKADLVEEGGCLVSVLEEGSQTIVTLLLVGRATPYLHNGVVYVGDEDHYAQPQFGVLARADVGLLVWDDAGDGEVQSRQPGSRLKTPALPVWVTSCGGHYGVMFNTNRELLRNYHAERRFELMYYSCGGGQWMLTVDTRYGDSDKTAPPKRSAHPADDLAANAMAMALQKVIHSKIPTPLCAVTTLMATLEGPKKSPDCPPVLKQREVPHVGC